MWFLETEFVGRPVSTWLLAVGVGFATLGALVGLRRLAARRLAALAGTDATTLAGMSAELVAGTRIAFLAVIAAFAGAFVVGGGAHDVMSRVAILALLLQGAIWTQHVLAQSIADYGRRRATEDPGAAMTVRAVGFVARLALWSLVLILALGNLGIDVTALVAGLGVGGIAVALAVQNILGDLFASLSIVLDKPFVQGDFIIVGDFMGAVDHVGLKTTRVRSLGGEQIIFSNADLLSSRIRNYKRMAERRVVFKIGVTYDTPLARLEEIPAMLREVVEARPKVRFDRAHFKAFGDFSLDFEVVYYVLDPDFNVHMDTQQAINFDVLRRFQAMEVAFAFPTQSIQMLERGAAVEAIGARAAS